MGFLDINNVTKSYGSVEVLHKVDISVEEGEFLVLVGPSGCGKSTLLNMIAGLEGITSGEISINGRVVNGVHPSKRNIAMVFQSYALYPNMTVGQNMTFGLEMHGVPKPERDKALRDVAALLQIEQLLDRRPGQLSGGQRQRVAMGRALVRNPDVFLFDEPLSNLDAKLRVDMRTEIKKLHEKLKTTVVYVTHDQIEALTLSTRIAVMNGGYIQQLGTPQDIYDNPANIFVATFMGSPSMNLVPGRISAGEGGMSVVLGAGGPGEAVLDLGAAGLAAADGQQVIMGVRPEALSDRAALGSQARHIADVPATVEVVEPAGADTFVTVRIGETEVVSRMGANSRLRPGEEITLSLDMDKVVFFDPKTEQRII
ncbi:sn-glycerol-3-phosphate ABC transporter ATP-binding protein UgpC [Loktanella sp. IMCC34160]|uniref:ABC transporter ATP-binding protein n=1 Tax=Loktanella sp. IMCC34160 TaxID=2510646 RepID=UPI00101CD8E6|nr:sn-glycerol-3-phosphate ABC transporter ATP-binding protein UgpC [Loktanella sp. IMCC34160]RYG89417.1 sn-glycerol-3-phosphate ABC transporter ATP-binding protein UgpC [Loktanella sp. IMCC34160]